MHYACGITNACTILMYTAKLLRYLYTDVSDSVSDTLSSIVINKFLVEA